jgi:hypothetical protein
MIDIQKKKAATAAWKLANREALNARQRDYNKVNFKRISANPRRRWTMFQYRSKKRGILVTLTYEEWLGLVKDAACHYCHKAIESNGCSLDRKDSEGHYSKDNVVPCCMPCNKMKSDVLSHEDMEYLMPLLLKFRARRSGE